MNVMLIFRLQTCNKETGNSEEVQQLSSINRMLCSNNMIQYGTEDRMLNDLKGNLDGTETSLKSLLRGTKLIFRYNEAHCNTCIEQALKPLMDYKEKIGVDNILILTSYKNARAMKIFIHKNAPGIPVFNTNEILNIPLEEWGIPYFFVTDENLKIELAFIPVKEINGYTNNYIDLIYRRLFISE